MNNPSNLKAHLFDLADQDRAALTLIRDRLEINSNALAVRLAIRDLARKLGDPRQLGEINKIPSEVAPSDGTGPKSNTGKGG